MDKNLLPDPPDYLTGEALQLWYGYCEELQSRNILKNSDLPTLGRLCLLESEAGELALTVAAEGPLTEDRDGTKRRHPAIMALSNLSTIVNDLKRNLAIGAYFRHKIEGKKPEAEKPLSRMMQMRQPKPPGPGGN